jgi:uncharacterized Zn-finger protein
MDDFITSYTDEVTCPYCGYEHKDSWELGHNRTDNTVVPHGEMNCASCNRRFKWERQVFVEYSTEKMEDE